MDNAVIAELLVRASADQHDRKQKALRRAARKALLWPEQAESLVEEDRSLTELFGVGPYVASEMLPWFDNPPKDLESPTIRRDFLSFAHAKEILNSAPDWVRDNQADLQMHSVLSDGASTIEELASAAQTLGHRYIAITDHSKGLKIAGGKDESAFREQASEIERFNASDPPVRVLRSIELNLSPDGSGDMQGDFLEELDLVLGSFHSRLRETEDQTDRYIAALDNPHVHILGHPRGRIYDFRLGLTANWAEVFDHAASLDKAVEIDCFPDRQDLSVEPLKVAARCGVRVSLGT
ncbi:MAG: PHP domain-containing protein, partial [Actinobacteria bacterium]|nr:PHP domain-containing protein [Actinomycetota bacterium]